ncbi:MAG: hypothetical protein VW576_05305, partial [Opitutae bacterium]
MVSILWSDEGKNSLVYGTNVKPGSSKVYQTEIAKNPRESPYFQLVQMIGQLEKDDRLTIIPANFPEIAVYFDARMAPGLYTQTKLIRSLIQFLEIRGFGKAELSLVTFHLDHGMRKKFATEFPGYQIITSEDEKYFHPDWFHDSPLPPAMGDRAELLIQYPRNSEMRLDLERKSFLPACLFSDQTYWI